jgi:hypothetical protein
MSKLKEKVILDIVKLAMSNDFDLEEYDISEIEISYFIDKIYKADQEKKVVEELDVEVIKCLIKLPVTDQDKELEYFKEKLAQGEELKYLPWGYELHIYPDGYVRYTDGATNTIHHANSIEISKTLSFNGYPIM